MNHTIKGILIVAAITSMLVLGATTIPIMQTSFASKKHDFKKAERDPNININTNSADSSSSSSATASNTNNIDNSATASQSQEQSACAVAVTCPEGTTTVTVGAGPPPPPADPCPHDPYTTFSGGVCQNGAPTITCSTISGSTGTPSSPQTTPPTCTAREGGNNAGFPAACTLAGGTTSGTGPNTICTYPATQTCPPAADTGEVGTVDPVSRNCAIPPETA